MKRNMVVKHGLGQTLYKLTAIKTVNPEENMTHLRWAGKKYILLKSICCWANQIHFYS